MENTVNPVENELDKAQKVKKKAWKLFMWACLAIVFQTLIIAVISSIVSSVAALSTNPMQYISADTAQDMTSTIMDRYMEFTQKYGIVISAVSYIPGDLIAAFLVLKFSKVTDIKRTFRGMKVKNFNVLDIILAILATLGISCTDSFIIDKLGSIFGSSSDYLGSTISFEGKPVWAIIVTIAYVALLGPVLEEILCRGAILHISSPIGKKFAIVASAVLFGIMHGNLSQFYNATLLGLLFAYVTYKTGSILIPSLMHIANNSLSLIITAIIENDPGAADFCNRTLTIILAVVGIAALVFLLIRKGKVNAEDTLDTNEMIKEEELASAKKVLKKGTFSWRLYLTSPFFWYLVAYLIFTELSLRLMPFLM